MNNAVLSKIASRFDANETIFFARELETIDPTIYMTMFAGLVGRKLIPLIPNVDPLDLTYTYRMWAVTGRSRVGGPNSNDDGVVGIQATEASTPIKSIPVEYGWTVDEIKQAAKKGVSLDMLTVQAAMAQVARKVDDMLALGEPLTTIGGLLNNATIYADNLIVATTKTGTGNQWGPASLPAEHLADLNNIVSGTRFRLKQASMAPGGNGTPAFDRFVVGLGSTEYSIAASEPRSTTSDTTTLQYALRNNPWIESIEEWWKLDTCDPSTSTPMIICYPRDPMALGAVIPREFESLPPQEQGRNIVIHADGKCGGTVIRYGVAVSYMRLQTAP